MNGSIALGVVLVLLGGLGLVGLFSFNESIDGFLGDRCRRGAVERDPNGYRARTWQCRAKPSRLAADLNSRHKPADRRSTPSGHFFRYRNRMIGMTPSGGGTKVYDARERDGYGFFNAYVGGWWGSYRGRAEDFRGGGPAAGK